METQIAFHSPSNFLRAARMTDSPACIEHRATGNALFGKSQYEAAAAAYGAALSSGPCSQLTTAVLRSNRAACYLQLRKPELAVEDSLAAVEADPGYHKALLRLAAAYAGLGHLHKALKAAQQGATAASDATLQSQFAKAAAEYKKAMKEEIREATQQRQVPVPLPGRSVVSTASTCNACGAVDAATGYGIRFRECINCRSVVYCTVECAAGHWYDNHKPVCDALKRKRESELPPVPSSKEEMNAEACTKALHAFSQAFPAHFTALQVLAFVLQHMAEPPWGGAPGPVQLEILNVEQLTDTKPLVVSAWPLSVLRDLLAKAKPGTKDLATVQDMVSGLHNVDVAVGFKCILPMLGPGAIAAPPMRYALSTDQLMELARRAEAAECVTIRKGVPVLASIDAAKLIAAVTM